MQTMVSNQTFVMAEIDTVIDEIQRNLQDLSMEKVSGINLYRNYGLLNYHRANDAERRYGRKPGDGTNSTRLFTPGYKAVAKSKVHFINNRWRITSYISYKFIGGPPIDLRNMEIFRSGSME